MSGIGGGQLLVDDGRRRAAEAGQGRRGGEGGGAGGEPQKPGRSDVTLRTRRTLSRCSVAASRASRPLPRYRNGKISVAGCESRSACSVPRVSNVVLVLDSIDSS